MTGDNDFWGGAMKTCAEQGKRMPTDAEITTLANDLYGETIGGGDGEFIDGLTMDEEKAKSYGITLTPLGDPYGNGFCLWSGQETDARNAHGREFFSVDTGWISYAHRDGSYPYLWAVCVGE